LITFTVTGFFKERTSGGATSGPLRYFNRFFVVARSGVNVTIVNDVMFVTLPTKEHIRVNNFLLGPNF
jgi:hypothetical protein